MECSGVREVFFCFVFVFVFGFVLWVSAKKQFWTKTFVVSLVVVSKERREEKKKSLLLVSPKHTHVHFVAYLLAGRQEGFIEGFIVVFRFILEYSS